MNPALRTIVVIPNAWLAEKMLRLPVLFFYFDFKIIIQTTKEAQTLKMEHLLENARQKMIMASLNQSTNPSARRIALLLAGVATAAGVAGSILLKNDTDEVTNLVPSHIHSNSRRQFTHDRFSLRRYPRW